MDRPSFLLFVRAALPDRAPKPIWVGLARLVVRSHTNLLQCPSSLCRISGVPNDETVYWSTQTWPGDSRPSHIYFCCNYSLKPHRHLAHWFEVPIFGWSSIQCCRWCKGGYLGCFVSRKDGGTRTGYE